MCDLTLQNKVCSIAVLYTLITIILIFLNILAWLFRGHLANGEIHNLQWNLFSTIAIPTQFYMDLEYGAGLCVLAITVYISLFIGALKRNRYFIIPFMIFEFFRVLTCIALGVGFLTYMVITQGAAFIVLTCICLVLAGTGIYLLNVVIKFFHQVVHKTSTNMHQNNL